MKEKHLLKKTAIYSSIDWIVPFSRPFAASVTFLSISSYAPSSATSQAKNI
jgi:hypothetical protein